MNSLTNYNYIAKYTRARQSKGNNVTGNAL